jgi:hypothetical protein
VSDFVQDASVALAWAIDNPVSVYASDVQPEMLRGNRGRVPPLWHFEIAQGLARAERRGDFNTLTPKMRSIRFC